jgi:uncharacterized protein YunC (DUF1805 family)
MEEIIIDGQSFAGWLIPTANANLLVIKGGRGMLACGYLKIETAEKLGDALAVVTGVKTFDDMLNAKVAQVSSAAARLGVEVGMSGRDALKKL